jgi:hypothetical protein
MHLEHDYTVTRCATEAAATDWEPHRGAYRRVSTGKVLR